MPIRLEVAVKKSTLLLILMFLFLFGNVYAKVKIETDQNFDLKKYKNIYIYIDTSSPKDDNLISGMTVRKSKEKVFAMFRGNGYNPIEISSFSGAGNRSPIVEIKMYESYFQYKTGGYSYNTLQYNPGRTYTVNTNSYATAYGSGYSTYGGYSSASAYGYGNSYSTVHESGTFSTQEHYVPERTETAKFNYGHIRIYNDKREDVFFASNSYTYNNNFVDVAEDLFLEIFQYIPLSDYYKPTVKYYGKNIKVYGYNDYIPATLVIKVRESVDPSNASIPQKGDLLIYKRSKATMDHVTDIATSLLIFYPFTKSPDDILAINSKGEYIWINKHKVQKHAALYTVFNNDDVELVKELNSLVRK